MARKRKKRRNDLRGVDPTTAQYWDEILMRAGLGMGTGTSSKLSYTGSSSNLEYIEGVESYPSGRVEPKEPSE